MIITHDSSLKIYAIACIAHNSPAINRPRYGVSKVRNEGETAREQPRCY